MTESVALLMTELPWGKSPYVRERMLAIDRGWTARRVLHFCPDVKTCLHTPPFY